MHKIWMDRKLWKKYMLIIGVIATSGSGENLNEIPLKLWTGKINLQNQ